MLDFIYSQVFWQQFGIATLIILIFFLLRSVFVKHLFGFIFWLTKKSPTELDTNILISFEKPLRVFIVFLGIYLASFYLPLTSQVDASILQVFRSIIIIISSWGLYNLIASSILVEEISSKLNVEIDPILIPFLSKLLQFIVVALALSVVAQEWGFDVNGFIAGLGLGGLAIALAAQDTIANLFGGVVIVTEKPFSIGDWIQTPDVEGTVEDITFRSTRVRTFANAQVTVPNSILANQAITNWTRMGRRRVTFQLGVTYSTPREKLKRCVERIQSLLENHQEVHKDIIFVRFDEFGASSLDIFIYFFTVTTNWADFLAVKEDINFSIMSILEDEGVSVAFPSRSLYFENRLAFSTHNMPDFPTQNNNHMTE